MHVLILGGTRFTGRALVDAALDRGDTVTLFNRGQTNPGLYPQAETIIGDRTGDLSALSTRHWDAVVDVAAYGSGLGHARVVYDALGHGERSYDSPEHGQIIARAARWLVAGLAE